MRILKYELRITDQQKIHTDYFHIQPLSVAEQNGKLMLWAKVYEDSPPEYQADSLTVNIVGTGQDSRDFDCDDFLGTVVMSNGFVWHVFARRVATKHTSNPRME